MIFHLYQRISASEGRSWRLAPGPQWEQTFTWTSNYVIIFLRVLRLFLELWDFIIIIIVIIIIIIIIIIVGC